ncbi:MAG: glycosyltransferase family 39 protein [Phycisphaerae bacterium]
MNDAREGGAARFGGLSQSLLVVIGAVFVSHLVYLAIDQRPFQWDDAWYAETAIRVNDAGSRDGIIGILTAFVEALKSKAPLIVACPQPLLFLFGRHDFVFGLTSALSLVVASIYLALLARMFVSRGGDALAVLILSLMPLTSGLGRQFMVEMPLTAILLMFVYHLLQSRDMQSRAHAAMTGVAAGLGMLAKVYFPLLVVGLFALLYLRLARRHKTLLAPAGVIATALIGPGLAAAGAWIDAPVLGLICGLGFSSAAIAERRHLTGAWRRNLLLALSLAIWLPLPWYFRNAQAVFGFALSNSFGEVSTYYGASDLFSLTAIRDYWIANVNFAMGVVFAVGLLALAVCLAALRVVGGPGDAGEGVRLRRVAALVAMWALPALIVFTLGRNRTPRFIMPLLPAAALLYVVLAQSLAARARILSRIIVSGHVGVAIIVYLISSFGGPGYTFGPGQRFVLWASRMSGRGAAEKKPFPLDAVLAQALRSSGATADRAARVLFLTDKPWVNLNSLAYTAAKRGANVVCDATAYQGSLEQAMATLPAADVLLYQEGGEPGPDFSNRWGPRIRQRIDLGSIPGWRRNSQAFVELPDGGVMRFYERIGEDEPPPLDLKSCCVLYRGAAYALLGIAMDRDDGGLRIVTRWAKLRPDDGRYVIAAHLVNESGRFARNVDHYPTGGPEAFAQMAVGDAITVATHVPIAAWADKAAYLRLALYDLNQKANVDCEILDGPETQPDNWGRVPLPLKQ